MVRFHEWMLNFRSPLMRDVELNRSSVWLLLP